MLARSPDTTHLDALISSALRGQPAPWRGDGDASVDPVFSRARMHGVIALMHARMPPAWPARLAQLCRNEAQALAMWELRHREALGTALAALAAAATAPLVIKGTALAYSLYADPALRTRADTDLLLAPGTEEATARALHLLGFERTPSAAPGYQATYTLQAVDGTRHALDIHWKINNSEVLSGLLTHDELQARARPLPALSPHALAPSPAHSLLIACMHRATHRHNPYHVAGQSHHEPDRLIWLMDIDLLARALDDGQWHEWATAVAGKGLTATAFEGLRLAQRSFQTTWPQKLTDTLETAPGAADRYLGAGALRQHWLDFVALRTSSRRARWVRDLALPPPHYMLEKYPSTAPLPWLYVRRAVGGLIKRLHI